MRTLKLITNFVAGYSLSAVGYTIFYFSWELITQDPYNPYIYEGGLVGVPLAIVASPIFLVPIAISSPMVTPLIITIIYAIVSFIFHKKRYWNSNLFPIAFVFIGWLSYSIYIATKTVIEPGFYVETYNEYLTLSALHLYLGLYITFPIFALISLRKPKDRHDNNNANSV